MAIRTPESQPTTTPKIIIGSEQQPPQPEKQPTIEVVSGFDNKPGLILPENYDQSKSGASGPVNITERQREYDAMKEEEQRKEAEAKQVGPTVIPQEKGRSIEGVLARTPEQQEQDRIKAEAEAKKILEDRLIEIRSTKPSSEQERVAFIEEASGIYEQLKKGDLKVVAESRARQKAAQDGLRIMTKQEFLTRENDPAKMAARIEKIKQNQCEGIVREHLRVFEDERKKYTGPDGKVDLGKFMADMEAKRQNLEKKGIVLSRDVFYDIIRYGGNPDAIKKRGLFSKRIEMGNYSNGKTPPIVMPQGEFTNWTAERQQSVDFYAGEAANQEINKTLSYGQKTWRGKKQEAVGDVLKEAIGEIQESRKPKPEEQPKVVAPEKPKPKIEIVSRIGRERTPEQAKEMEKIRKQVEADIERRQKVREKIIKLRTKAKKQILTAAEVAYLNTVAAQEQREAA